MDVGNTIINPSIFNNGKKVGSKDQHCTTQVKYLHVKEIQMKFNSHEHILPVKRAKFKEAHWQSHVMSHGSIHIKIFACVWGSMLILKLPVVINRYH